MPNNAITNIQITEGGAASIFLSEGESFRVEFDFTNCLLLNQARIPAIKIEMLDATTLNQP